MTVSCRYCMQSYRVAGTTCKGAELYVLHATVHRIRQCIQNQSSNKRSESKFIERIAKAVPANSLSPWLRTESSKAIGKWKPLMIYKHWGELWTLYFSHTILVHVQVITEIWSTEIFIFIFWTSRCSLKWSSVLTKAAFQRCYLSAHVNYHYLTLLLACRNLQKSQIHGYVIAA
jgi:hypothetical protein